jgi:hypothetical protein
VSVRCMFSSDGDRRSPSRLVIAAAMLGMCALGAPSVGRTEPCPTAPDPAALPDAAALKAMNAFVARLGVRPTGSPAHVRYIDWIRRRLRKIPGVALSELDFPIGRWTAQRTKLTMSSGGKTVRLPVAGSIPYTAATGGNGVTAPLALIPGDQAITAANASGRIVVRPAPAGSVPQVAFSLPIISWETYDPGNTIDMAGTFYGDFIAYNSRVKDLRDAAAAGAAGILFVKELPRSQLVDHYEPYEGTQWDVPGAFLGADEGTQITDAIDAGAQPSAGLVVRARVKRVVTPSILTTLPGQSPERIVIDSHTDGTNAVEDNGPVAMVAMARYFAALPMACRPRTIQFAFSTAHFYQRVADPAVRDGGAEQLAQQLDRDYDQGTVSVVLVLEHLGAIDYEQVARPDGIGKRLEPNGLRAIQFIGVTPSSALVATVGGVVRAHDMQRTILLRGSDVPGNTVPAHCSFGGEGTPYERHLLPTIGVIAAPQSLYDPAFGLEGIDFDVMGNELRGFTELVNRLGTMDQSAIAGDVPTERAQRAAGAPACPPAN